MGNVKAHFMASITQELFAKGLIKPPRFVPTNMIYETIMGSVPINAATNAIQTIQSILDQYHKSASQKQ